MPLEERAYLNSCFRQVSLEGNLLPRVDVGIVCLLEGSFQFLQLSACKGGSDPPLFPLLRQDALMWMYHTPSARAVHHAVWVMGRQGTVMMTPVVTAGVQVQVVAVLVVAVVVRAGVVVTVAAASVVTVAVVVGVATADAVTVAV